MRPIFLKIRLKKKRERVTEIKFEIFETNVNFMQDSLVISRKTSPL